MQLRLLAEINRKIPERLYKPDGFVFEAYGCAVLENFTDDNYFEYTAVNLSSGKKILLERRRDPLTQAGVERILVKLRYSKIAGLGRLEAESETPLTHARLLEIIQKIFKEVLPEYGYNIRNGQIDLAEKMLESIAGRNVLLTEAAVGIGKTIAYIIVGALIKRSRINQMWCGSLYPGITASEWENMPVLISTSSIALQKAVLTEYIPEISRILFENGVIKTPLRAILRKGKGHYICEYNLRSHLPYEQKPEIKKILTDLIYDKSKIDLAEIDGITPHIKNKICVPSKCNRNCQLAETCRYRKFRREVKNNEVDFQICNHNLLLADLKLRAEEKGAVLPPYQMLVIDEAHKLLPAAQSIYGSEFSADTVIEITKTVLEFNFSPSNKNANQKEWRKNRDKARMLVEKLFEKNKKLFSFKKPSAACDQIIRNIRDISEDLYGILKSSETFQIERDEKRKQQLIRKLELLSETADALSEDSEQIRWFEDNDESNIIMRGLPKRLNELIYDDLWSRGIPSILTSGTLSVNGDFSAVKQSVGLSKVKRITEITQGSPFDYQRNCLLYIPEHIPFPDKQNEIYLDAITDEIEKLITVSHGHAAILFTSYNVMGRVYAGLLKRNLKFPFFRLDKGGVREIEKFKQSGHGVLFAAGALWEGIDIPGDALSMLIIVKLPFAVPDTISEYEQTLYKDMREYKELVIKPEMLIKNKQGSGRLLRTETDTGVIALFDCRVNEDGAYRECVLAALPECRVTNDIYDVEDFFTTNKSPDYFRINDILISKI